VPPSKIGIALQRYIDAFAAEVDVAPSGDQHVGRVHVDRRGVEGAGVILEIHDAATDVGHRPLLREEQAQPLQDVDAREFGDCFVDASVRDDHAQRAVGGGGEFVNR
jgi:hypothetical protein